MLISVIVPVTSAEKRLERMLESLFMQEDISDCQIIVIDNGTQGKVENLIRHNYPDISLIVNQKNEGSSIARNQGMASAKGDYIVFMDCDIELERNFFTNLKIILKDLPKGIAGLSPKIIDKETERVFSCGLFVSPIYRVHDVGRQKLASKYSTTFRIDGPNSCCAIFRRSFLEEVKEKDYFDKDFFFLFEDADLALRLKKKGYKCVFTPDLITYHYGNSSGISQERRRFFCFRNRLYMVIKYNHSTGLLKFFLKSFFYDLFRTIHFFLTNRYFFEVWSSLVKKYQDEKNSYN